MSFAGPRPHFSPLDTSSSSMTPFDPRFTVTIPLEVLRCRRHEDADTFLQRVEHLWSADELRNVRRTDLFFAFRYHHQIHWHLFADTTNCVQRCKKRGFRS